MHVTSQGIDSQELKNTPLKKRRAFVARNIVKGRIIAVTMRVNAVVMLTQNQPSPRKVIGDDPRTTHSQAPQELRANIPNTKPLKCSGILYVATGFFAYGRRADTMHPPPL